MNKAVFLDRDGTLNIDPGYVRKIEDFELYPNVIKALKLLKNFQLFIITNQSGIGRGYYTEKDFHKFNNHLIAELRKEGINIKETFYCPHHPDEECDCRKPSTRFIKEAAKKYLLHAMEKISALNGLAEAEVSMPFLRSSLVICFNYNRHVFF